MENNLSEPLNEISEKLTTISEEVKKLQKENKPISTGKTCPYRRAILWTALILQVLGMFSVDVLSADVPYFVRSFIALLTYIVASLAGEILIYRLMGKKESMRANAEAVQEKYDMTLDELDIYIQKLANIRILASIVALMTFIIVSMFSLYGYIVSLSYFLTTLISIFYVRMRGKIRVPKRFFLFDLPKGQGGGGGLPHRSYEHQSIEDYAYGGSRERHREFLYGKD
jgi:hypothetical protein